MNSKCHRAAIPVFAALLMAACAGEEAGSPAADSGAGSPDATGTDAMTEVGESSETMSGDNPFLVASPLYLQYPPFDRIDDSHYLPAFEAGMAEHLAEIDAIVAQDEAPTVENTLVPMELSGQVLNRVSRVFFGLMSAHTNDEMQAIEVEIAPQLSAHSDSILLNGALFERVRALYDSRESLDLDPESLRLVEETHRQFVRAGAELSEEQKERLRAINTELAELETEFSQNVLNEVNAMFTVVDTREELAGLTEAQIEGAADEAESRELAGRFVIPMVNTTQQPLMAALENRDLRERMLAASMSRGNHGGEYDNREIVSRTAMLRAERAALLGYETHADYILDNQTAKTVAAVNERLASLTPPSVANAEREAADLQAMIDAEGGDFELAAWDWDFYTDKVRQERFQFDASQLKPYLELNSVLVNGVFFAATQVFGITFEERFDLPVYQEDVRVFEVFDHDGSTLSLFIFDPYARESKRGGAWMNSYVSQSHLEDKLPVVGNHLKHPRTARGRTDLDDLQRGHHHLPRVRARAARHVLRRELPVVRRHERAAGLRGIPVPGQRDVGHVARSAGELRPALRDRRAHAAGSAGPRSCGGAVQPGLRDDGIPGRIHHRPGAAPANRRPGALRRRPDAIRSRRAGRGGRRSGHRAATLPPHLLLPHHGRLLVRLLLLHLERSTGCRHRGVDQGERRP